MSEVSRVLSQIEQGEPNAAEQLLPLVYDELRKLAASRLAQEKPGQTLQPTALVHEAYLRLVGGGARDSGLGTRDENSAAGAPSPGPQPLAPSPSPCFDSRGHFFAAAAEAMRRILVDQARRKQTVKQGGACIRQEFDEACITATEGGTDVLAVSDALDQLAEADAQAAELVKLRYFAGLTSEQAAAALGVSPRTADRIWVYARSFLLRALERG